MLYIMRHGRTDWNARHKMQGHTDIPLNDGGRKMAKEAREKYVGPSFDVCYCSPLMRAKETAEIFLEEMQTPIFSDDRLIEMSFGVYEGVENSFEIPDCPINQLFEDPVHYKPVEGGESFEELFARTGEFLREVVEPLMQQGKNVLIVGHGAMNGSIICQMQGIPLANFWERLYGNCELIRLI